MGKDDNVIDADDLSRLEVRENPHRLQVTGFLYGQANFASHIHSKIRQSETTSWLALSPKLL